MNLYQEHILDHYKNPQNVGEINGAASAKELNPLCGDEIETWVKTSPSVIPAKAGIRSSIRVEDDIVCEIRHRTRGCAITIASASILSNNLLGKTANAIDSLTEGDVLSILNIELTPARIKCAMLPVWAIKTALASKDQ